jgi:hypothetical protein
MSKASTIEGGVIETIASARASNLCLTCALFPVMDCGYLDKRAIRHIAGYKCTIRCKGYRHAASEEYEPF